ncbi:MAG TPA: hypothetical protein GXX24_13170 [Paracoccus solventivorans]|uniref:Creatinase/Prolidase N-terminal domain-containing protein n=1 Tax=Paracoccus solventivorans TaxID=53463 RepID=A0A832QXF3_9RHOB|nr:hypothetical protein [Paracoccus solventivorans]HHW35069.1 hypothetical protein [Paracoccus solventivorans]
MRPCAIDAAAALVMLGRAWMESLMHDDTPVLPPAPAPRRALAMRQMALRAIMDGRGVDSVILSAPASLAHYGGMAPGGLLVVTAQAAQPVPGIAGEGGPPRPFWPGAAELLRRGCRLGYEGGWIDADALALLVARLAPAGLLDIGPEVERQIGSGADALPGALSAGRRVSPG